uniref:Variant surface glycoprotein n=1 Tax=Panagrellus redivivus TaxID=6233 RepID=A0A7E4WAS2_PANRE
MRLPIITLLGVVAVSTVGAQDWCDEVGKFPDPDCPLTVRMAPISGSNDAKEQEAVDKLAAIGLLNAISQVAENSPPEQTRGLIGKIINKAKDKAKGVLRRVKDKVSRKIGKYGTKLKCRYNCKASCPIRYCKLRPKPRPRPIEPVYEPEPIEEPESDQQGDYQSEPGYGADESEAQSENGRFFGLGGLLASVFG